MIIFLYGEDTFRARKKLNELKEKFLREVDPSGNSLVALDGEKATMEKVNESISASSLLAKKRMIVIENLFTNKIQTIFNQINKYFIERQSSLSGDSAGAKDGAKDSAGAREDNIIIFLDSISGAEKLPKYKSELFQFLSKQKYAQEFKTLSNTEATAWAKKEVESRGGKISHQAAMELTSLLGSDLWQINNEIDKLINFKAGQKLRLSLRQSLSAEDSDAMATRQSPLSGDSAGAKLHLGDDGKGTVIEIEDVKKLVRGQFDENIFALTDAISNKNKSAAIKLFEEQIEAGLTDGYLLNMIVRQFRILMQIRQALDSGLTSRKIINLLKLHPFIVQKGIGQARNFNLASLKNIFSKLVEIDYGMKSGKTDVKPALSLLIARI